MFLLWMIMEKLAGLHDQYLQQQQFATTLILIPSVIIYVLALPDKKKNSPVWAPAWPQGLYSMPSSHFSPNQRTNNHEHD